MQNTNSGVLVLPALPKTVQKGGGVAVAGLLREYDSEHYFFTDLKEEIKSNKKKPLNSKVEKRIFESSFIGEVFFLLNILKRSVLYGASIRKAKVIIAHTFWEGYLAALYKYYLNPALKLIYVYHGVGKYYNFITNLNGYHFNSVVEGRFDKREDFIFEHADKYGFPSRGAAETFNSDKVKRKQHYEVLPNTISNAKISNPGASKEENSFIVVSTLNNDKGVDRLLPCLDQYASTIGSKVSLTIVGDGPLASEIDSQIKLYRNVDVNWSRQAVQNADLRKILATKKYYICLHRKSIFDIVIIEAISCGCFPVLTNVGGNPEFLPSELHENLIENVNEFPSKMLRIDQNLNSLLAKSYAFYKTNLSPEAFKNRYREVVSSVKNTKI